MASIDVLVGGRTHDLTSTDDQCMGPVILDAARRGGVAALHAAVPCQTFSVARDDEDMLRSADYPSGLPGLPPAAAAQLFLSNALVRYTIDVATAVAASGGEVTIENPAPRNDADLPHVYWPAKAHHASLFQMPEARGYAEASTSSLITFPMCALGSPMQKYTSILATPGAAAVLSPLDDIQCTHVEHTERAYGALPDGSSASRAAGRYPESLSLLLASALAGSPASSVDVRGDAPLPAVSSGAAPAEGAPLYAAVDLESSLAARVSEDPVVVTSAYLQECAVCAPGYEAPTNPGWHDAFDADASDEECNIFAAEVGGCPQSYVACTKQPLHIMRVQSRVRWSQGPDGMRRHDVPRGYDEYLKHPDQALIFEAMQREMDSHEDCGTWEYRDAAECYDAGRVPIDCMWVYDCKVDATSKRFLLWKARLVGRGDQMEYLRDYFATYSGVVRHETFRIFLAVAAVLSLALTGADVSTAYLHAPLRDAVVWMKQPRGFPQVKVNGKPALCRLRMALYGLRQSAREWALTLIAWLEEYGFVRCVADRYMFVWHGVVRSVTGWLLMLGGAAVSWAVRGQRLPSLSSAEAELYGLSTAVCNVLVCIQVLEELGVDAGAPVTVFTDSRGARLLALDCASAARTRHIHRRWYFVRHHADDGTVVIKAIKGSDNHFNFLTKPVGGAAFAADRKFALCGL